MHAVKVYTTTKNTNFNYRTDLSSCACDRWSERGWTGGGIVRRSTIWRNPSGRQRVLQICKNFPAIRMLSRSKDRDTICIFFFFFYSNYGSGEQLAVVFCRNCDWYIAARSFRCRLPLETDRGNERFRRSTKFSANISRLFFEQQRV